MNSNQPVIEEICYCRYDRLESYFKHEFSGFPFVSVKELFMTSTTFIVKMLLSIVRVSVSYCNNIMEACEVE